MSDEHGLVAARSQARKVWELYEILEQRQLGRT
jgi:hypothetical protein